MCIVSLPNPQVKSSCFGRKRQLWLDFFIIRSARFRLQYRTVRAKVKTTVIDTGQEYLLLVAKMNLKGILVNTSQMLKPNTQLMLELKLNEQEPILLKGYVHKISEETSSKKGMVIAFSNPSDESKRKIQRFIDDSKEISAESRPNTDEESAKKKSKWTIRKKKEKAEIDKMDKKAAAKEKTEMVDQSVQQNKTMIVGEDDLPSMKLSSPDNSKELAVATMDEESLHAKNPGLSGSTRHVKLDSAKSSKKSDRKPFRMTTIYKAFGFVVVVIVLVLAAKPALEIMDKKFGKKITLPTFGSQTTTNKAPDHSKSTTGQIAADSVLEIIQVDDQGGFLKISLLGKGNFANNKIMKMTESSKIQIELLEITENKSPAMVNVNNNPISKIAVSKVTGTVVDIFYTSKEPPNYEAKVFNGGLDIFIYR